MPAPGDDILTPGQLRALQGAFHEGAAQASRAFSAWAGKPSVISVESVRLLPLGEATDSLGSSDTPVGFCSMEMTGRLTGQLLLAFDNASGMALADLLLEQPLGTADEWGEMEMSAAMETTNIVGCAFLNSLATALPASDGPAELIPTPPTFGQEFGASLMQFALMDQAVATDHALVAKTQFQIDGTPVDWTLLFIPDAESLIRLGELLPDDGQGRT